MNKSTWKGLLVVASIALGALWLAPSISFYSKPRAEQDKLRDRRNPILAKILNLGLDLQGGIHLLLELQTDALPDDRPETLREAMDRAMEVVRNRIDQYGLSEPLIVRQGEKWIVVQLPGVKDREQAKDLIGRTALLEFRIVEEQSALAVTSKAAELGVTPQDVASGKIPDELKKLIPAGTALFSGREDRFLLLREKAEMTGSALQAARVDMGGGGDFSMGAPVVALEFNPEGAKQFAAVTGANVNRRMAIVLDGVVQSAPVIRSSIPDGHAIIEGNFSPEDAKFLKTVLQAGALPAPLVIMEERTVGPTLGEDSIKAGMAACAAGVALVFVFMAVYYKWSGVVADFALLLNLFLLLAAMAMMKATLTLPGIAGIILSIGMSVDANILILERAREELALGKPPRLALEQGYDRAFSAIWDGNVTAVLAALFLFQFGTGPVKGFGISLILGLMMSMFTATVATRAVYDLWFQFRPAKRLSI